MSPPSPPTPLPPNGRAARNSYLRGLALGSIPLIVFWILGGIAGFIEFSQRGGTPSYAGAAPFFLGIFSGALGLLVVLISAIVRLSSRNTRPLGYGLLTMVLVSPVVAASSCQIYLAALSAIPR